MHFAKAKCIFFNKYANKKRFFLIYVEYIKRDGKKYIKCKLLNKIVNDFYLGGKYKVDVLKVSTKSNPNSVAGALAAIIKEKNIAEIQAVGAGAINQAVKAIAIARGFVAPSGKDIVCIPAFTDILIDGEERTAIKLIVQPR